MVVQHVARDLPKEIEVIRYFPSSRVARDFICLFCVPKVPFQVMAVLSSIFCRLRQEPDLRPAGH